LSRRTCFALDLVSDAALIAEYVRLHEPGAVWPAIIQHLRAQGVESMEIWQRGDRLFMILEASDEYPRPNVDATASENRKWEQYMSTFQRVLPDAAPGEKWSEMRRIFCLAHHGEVGRRELQNPNAPNW
jgi:L-rhamnose mutarotase